MDHSLQIIISKIRHGDKKAFEILFKHYSPKLLHFSQRYFDNIEDCEEIVQEVFIKIWKTRQKINKVETFESYLYTIAKNHIYNFLKRKVYQKAINEFNLSVLLNETYKIEKEQNFKELFLLTKAITRTLPEQQRKIFILSRLKGMSNKEIAKKLGISNNTVETHMRLALKKFRNILEHNNYLAVFIELYCCYQMVS